jgi:alcohol dehydrogenase
MKAVVFEGERKVAVCDFPDPALFDERSAIVEVEQTSICGSDLHFYWGDFGDFSGVRPGHEFIGTVVATGKEVTHLRVGDRVMNMALYGCGDCDPCHELRPTACAQGWVNFGTLREVPGGQCQLVAIPHADHVLLKLPSWVTDDQAILMTDVLPTGAFAARNASITPGATVVVIGLGPIGLSVVANALTYSPARVLAFDNLPDRRERAEALGAEVFDPAVAPASAQVAELTSGRGADCVIEAVGHAATLVESMRSARVGGTVSVIGLITDTTVPVSPIELGIRNLTVRFGTTDVPLMWDRLFPLLEQGKLDLGNDVFTHRLPLDQAVQGYEIFANRHDQVFKVVFDPKS